MKYVVTIKDGDNYSSDDLNRLYRAVKRNADCEMICLTDNMYGLDNGIVAHSFPDYPLYWWWWKMWIMSEEFPYKGELLYMDSDTVVCGNIEKFWEYKKGEVVFISQPKAWSNNTLLLKHKDDPSFFQMDGSLMRIEHGQLDWLWKRFISKSLEEWDKEYAAKHNAGKSMKKTRLYDRPAEDIWIRWQLEKGIDYECFPWDWAVNYRDEWKNGYRTENTSIVTLHMEDKYSNLNDPELIKHIQ